MYTAILSLFICTLWGHVARRD